MKKKIICIYIIKNITSICEEIIRSEKCSLRIGLVNYRDHPPQDTSYITQINQFTDNIATIKDTLINTKAQGGGDLPESICCGMNDCLEKLDWRSEAVKVAILIADAPPHGLGCAVDSFPDGCPLKNDPVEIAHKMAQKGITLYCSGCEPVLDPFRQFFIALCLITGGQYVSLKNAANLSSLIVGGTKEEISMEKMISQVQNDLMKEAAQKGQKIDEEELTKRVHEIINSRNSFDCINKLNSDIQITEAIKELSKMKNLDQMKKSNHSACLVSSIPLFSYSPLKKPLIKNTHGKETLKTTVSRLTKTKITNKVRLRRSKRIKEIEQQKRKLMLAKIKSVPKKSVKRKFLNARSDSDKENKHSRRDSSSTEILTESNDESKTNQLIDINQARRVAKKIIARNLK